MCFQTKIREQDCNKKMTIEASNVKITSIENQEESTITETISSKMQDLLLDHEENSKKHLLRSSYVDGEYQYEIQKRDKDDQLASSSSRIVRKPLKSCMAVRSMSESLHSDPSSRPRRMSDFSVGFKSVEIRDYFQILGDNPAVSRGPAMTLDWEYDSHQTISIDSYEGNRGRRRFHHEMMIPRFVREHYLRKSGYSKKEIDEAVKAIDKVKSKRKKTVKNIRFENVEYAVERTKRKIKKLLSFGKTEAKSKILTEWMTSHSYEQGGAKPEEERNLDADCRPIVIHES